ncbi:MAG TPA: 5-formyltetrahydrofolate cyclo-ligase [Streptosporangiaceae bacterium]|nr:5-formyltetrahydrofolate cyclo-ligase [Streptosporangiaceae bacterium]
MHKSQLRAKLSGARAEMSDAMRTEAGRALRDAVLDLPQVRMAGTVAAYYSVGTEPDTRGLVYALWKRGTYVLLPVMLPDGDLDWASYEGPASLVPGRHGLLEPAEPLRGVAAVARADAVIVPALAVARSTGVRLGRGAGCYDRALARVGGQIPVIALLYDDELVDSLPADPHDRQVTHVARPSHGISAVS